MLVRDVRVYVQHTFGAELLGHNAICISADSRDRYCTIRAIKTGHGKRRMLSF